MYILTLEVQENDIGLFELAQRFKFHEEAFPCLLLTIPTSLESETLFGQSSGGLT